jgi:hypothetical protein
MLVVQVRDADANTSRRRIVELRQEVLHPAASGLPPRLQPGGPSFDCDCCSRSRLTGRGGFAVEAVRWKLVIEKFIAEQGYKIGTVVAFSGSDVNDPESGRSRSTAPR